MSELRRAPALPDVGAFAKPAPERRYGATLHRQRLHLARRYTAVTFVTPQLPATAGIDPDSQLIDRIPDDNLTDVRHQR